MTNDKLYNQGGIGTRLRSQKLSNMPEDSALKDNKAH